MEHVAITSTLYDDVFRTLLNDCTSLMIPLINEVFGEQYCGFCYGRSEICYGWQSFRI